MCASIRAVSARMFLSFAASSYVLHPVERRAGKAGEFELLPQIRSVFLFWLGAGVRSRTHPTCPCTLSILLGPAHPELLPRTRDDLFTHAKLFLT